MEFKVKRDFLMIFICEAIFAFLIFCSVFFFFNTWVGLTILLVISILDIIYNISVIFAICVINKKQIMFKTGFFKYNIYFDDIIKIEKSKNCYSSLSLSFDRIRIVTKKKEKQHVYYISVKDNDKLFDVVKNLIAQTKEIKEKIKDSTKKENKNKVKKDIKKSSKTKSNKQKTKTKTAPTKPKKATNKETNKK